MRKSLFSWFDDVVRAKLQHRCAEPFLPRENQVMDVRA